MLARSQLLDDLRVLMRSDAQLTGDGKRALDRFGIMGGNDPPRQGDVGEVLAICVEGGVGRVGRA